MSSRVSSTIFELGGFRQFSLIETGARLLAALLALSAGLASAQNGSGQLVETNSLAQSHVSVNQLITPGKAKKATEKAREALAHGHYEVALREAEHAIDIFPRSGIALSIEGAVNFSRANYAESSRDFQLAIDADPALGTAYLGLGMAFTSQGRFKDALVPLDRAAVFLPNSWMVYFEAALAHLGIGDPETALKEITYAERFMGADPKKRSGVSYLRGVAHFQMNNDILAIEELYEAVDRDPNGKYATLARGRLEELGSSYDDQQIAHSNVRNHF